jgi:hydrogenase maturation factor
MTASLLFPAGANAAGIRETMRAMQAAALANRLILCGGHTEVTDAVTRPVIAAQVTGTVARIHLIRKRDMAETDRIVMTKALAVEGTSIIAREFPERLRALGMDEEAIDRCRNFLHDPGISILAEARIAAGTGKVSAMHDVTEGGLATALQEFSVAGGHRMRIQANRIPMFPETREICLGLGISPLGLIGSGSLLITCAADFADNIASQLRAGGIEAVIIGDVLGEGSGVEAVDEHGHPCPWPEFETDELTRLSTVGGRET